MAIKKAIPNQPKSIPKMRYCPVSLQAEQILRRETTDKISPAIDDSQTSMAGAFIPAPGLFRLMLFDITNSLLLLWIAWDLRKISGGSRPEFDLLHLTDQRFKRVHISIIALF